MRDYIADLVTVKRWVSNMVMKEIGRRIKQIRIALGLTQAEFGSKVGLSAGTLSGIEQGKRGVKKGVGVEALKRIAQVYGVDLNWLITGRGQSEIVGEAKGRYQTRIKIRPIPLISHLPPTYPKFDELIVDYLYLPGVDPNCFALKVWDQSMSPELNPDDIIIVNPRRRSLRSGEIGLFRVGGDLLLRYYYTQKDLIFLRPRNLKYPPLLVNKREFTVLGRVIVKIVSL